MAALPVWAKLLRRADRLAWYAYHAHEIVRDETLFAWLAPELRAELTVLSYSDMATYLPGGATYEAGLFPWERALWANPLVPKGGRVLLAAAGGGRELRALCQSGYEVEAFEPNPLLFEGARATSEGFSKASVLAGTYADLVSAVEQRQGPLAPLAERRFDWVLFGWGSFTHVTEPAQQLQVLRAALALAPSGPLVLSFFLRKGAEVPSRSLRLREAVRSVFRSLGAARARPTGLGYEYGGGFVYHFTEQELERLAQQAGYRVALFDDTAFPHAVLLPTQSSRTDSG